MNAVVPFTFDDRAVRVTDRDGQPWFVLADACAVLGLKNPTMAARPLDETEKAQLSLGRGGDTTIVSLAGLLTLMLRCRNAMKPGSVPYRVRKWITAEVVPTIMRTGSYGTPAVDVDDNAQLRALLLGKLDQVDALKPKADALDRIADARGAMPVTEAAKVLKLGRDELYRRMHALRWIYRAQASGRWMAFSDKERAGLLEHRVSRIPSPHGPDKVATSVLVTAKGMAKLAELLGPRKAAPAA